jgi:hypothetical protein
MLVRIEILYTDVSMHLLMADARVRQSNPIEGCERRVYVC